METCPKIPMLAFELKTCNYDPGDFADKILHYIMNQYQEDPESFQKEINEFFQLRENTINASRDFMGLNLMKRYYRQLVFLSNRFPMKSGEECETEFSWDEMYSQKEIVHNDIRFELECILYNIGAMHSYLGCVDKRSNDEGIKISCTHFQYAAWAFQQVRELYSSLEFADDCSADIMTFKMNVMLAQAQECVLEKSIVDGRKPSINAKVVAQCIDYYKLALVNLEKPNTISLMGSRKAKDFKQYIQFKSSYYAALFNYYCALNSSELKKHGEAVGYVQQAEAKIAECVKQKYLKEFQETLKHAQETIEAKAKQLRKDNDFVYNEKIPDAAVLPEVKGVSLVKCLPIDFDNDPELVIKDIFARLVSMKAHELSSIYRLQYKKLQKKLIKSEEKAKILREINSQVSEKNNQLEAYMSAMQLDQLHLQDHDYLKLPKTLLECCAGVNGRSALIKVEIPNVMKSIVGASTQAKSILDDVQDLLEEEHEASKSSDDDSYSSDDPHTSSSYSSSEDDDDYDGGRGKGKDRRGGGTRQKQQQQKQKTTRGAAGKKKKPPVSERKRRLRELIRRYERLTKSYEDANQSNVQLREAFDVVIKDLHILALPLSELSAQLPQIELEPNEASTNGSGANAEQLKSTREKLVSLLAKVDEMRQQRSQLVNRLQFSLKDDDPTQTIAANQNEIDPKLFFAKNMEKHGQLTQYIQQNLVAQENILRALTEANASYAIERQRLVEASKKRNEVIERLIASYHRIDELVEKARKGVTYFETLAREPLKDLLKDVKEFCEWSRKQRQAAATATAAAAKRPPNIPPRQTAPNGFADAVYIIGSRLLGIGDDEKEINKILASMSMLPDMPPLGQVGIPQQQQQQMRNSFGMAGASNIGSGGVSITSDRPKLKDFLPYMKPGSWANKGNSNTNSMSGGGGLATAPAGAPPQLSGGLPQVDRSMFSSGGGTMPPQQMQVAAHQQGLYHQSTVGGNSTAAGAMTTTTPSAPPNPQLFQTIQHQRPQQQQQTIMYNTNNNANATGGGIVPNIHNHHQMSNNNNLNMSMITPNMMFNPNPNASQQQHQMMFLEQQQKQKLLEQQKLIEQQQKLAEQQKILEQQKALEQQRLFEQQRLVEQQRIEQQKRLAAEQERLAAAAAAEEAAKKQRELDQQRLLEQKQIEQQMKEREIEMKKRQLEEQELRLRMQQQQFILQQHQQQQQHFQIPAATATTTAVAATLKPNTVVSQEQIKPPKLDEMGAAIYLNDLKPESIYKPGFFSQLKLPTTPATAATTNTTTTSSILQPTKTPSSSFNQVMSNMPPIQTSNLPSHQVATTFLPQQHQPLPQPSLNPNQVHHVNPVQKKPTAFDDLLDLFEGPNNNGPTSSQIQTSNVLEPVKIQHSLI